MSGIAIRRRRHTGRLLACVCVGVALVLASCTTYSTPSSSDNSVDLLHDRGAAQNAVGDMVKAVGADPAQVTLVYLYGEYANMDAQDPKVSDHVNSFNWRDDTVDPSTPEHLSGPIEDTYADLFPTSAVRWSDIPRLGATRRAAACARRADACRGTPRHKRLRPALVESRRQRGAALHDRGSPSKRNCGDDDERKDPDRDGRLADDGRQDQAAAFSRMWIAHDEPSPMTCAMPTFAPSI